MFHRRRAASSPPNRAPSAPSAAAALAASQAFLKNHSSNASLSNAAAAAALRTHATTPTPVGDIQTKRMIRRGSTSSQGSNGSNSAPGLRRQSSSGSMSERTFRAPSPNRSSPVVKADPNAPPVPPIPQEVPAPVVQKRASSLEPPFRGASPRRGGGRGVSVDRGMPAAGRGHTRGASSLAQVPEVDRENSLRTINYSRPISISPPASPSPSPVVGRTGHSGWFTSPVVENNTFRDDSMTRPKTVDEAKIRNSFTEQSIRNAPEMPVQKNRSQFASGAEGARLSSGHMGARITGTAVDAHSRPSTSSGTLAVDPKSPLAVYDPSTRKFFQKQAPEPAHEQPAHRRVEHPQSSLVSQEERPPSPSTQQTPSTGFQTRAGALLARKTSEDYGEDDQVQNIPDANTSRRLDPTPSSQDQEHVQNTTSQENQSSAIIQPRSQTPTNTLSAGKHGSVRGERPPSLSPGRSAHFATSSVELPNGVKHLPPPRSISPTKSALKHSPSSSIRTHSPVVITGRGAPSEASDTMSEDGSKPTPKRKKNVRVSFDDGPVIAGTSAYAENSPTSPRGLETSKWSTRAPTSREHDIDEVMTPRPALPSFGSIRDSSRQTADEDMAEKVTETIPSSMSTSASTIAEPLDVSSDHALASIITHDFVSKTAQISSPQGNSRRNNNLEPIPPEVTSVEGSGYVSDSDQSMTTQEEVLRLSSEGQSTPAMSNGPSTQTSKPTLQVLSETPRQKVAVPEIAVLPATPGPEEEPGPKYIMPGGFPDQFEENHNKVETEKHMNAEVIPTQTPRELMNRRHGQDEHIPAAQEHSDDSDDESSIYSDAAEDFSDDEGQFASIDAVVDSPISKPRPGLAMTTPPDSPVMLPPSDEARSPPENGDLSSQGRASNHGAGVNEAQNQRLDSEAQPKAPKKSSIVPDVPFIQPAKAKKRNVAASSASQAPPRLQTDLQQQVPAKPRAQPRKSALKNPMRQDQGSAAYEPHIRKTMRTGNAFQESYVSSATETHLKKSMRGGDAIRSGPRNEPGLAASRYSTTPTTREPRGALQKKNIPAATKARPQSASGPLATTSKPHQTVPLGRTFSNDDSDASESSFKRERRRPKGSDGERYSMRRSMRGGPAPSAPAPTMRPQSAHVKPLSPPPTMRTSMRPSSPTPASTGIRSSRFSIRSLSPSGGGISSKSKRTGSIDASTPTLRSQSERPGTKFGGFGKAAKPKPAAPSKPASRFQSRFADSSDDDDDRPVRFQSRFADSDDDDDYVLPAGLTPVRGIPRKPGDDDRDSTDLSDEDSSTERLAASKNKDIEKGPTKPITNGRPDISFASSSLRKSKHAEDAPSTPTPKKEKSKRGFFGLGKKKQAAAQPGEISSIQPLPIPDPPSHRLQPEAEPQPEEPQPLPQTQRPLTPIGEDDKAIEAASPASPGSARSPKLQRRHTPQWGRSTSDSWPLPQPAAIGQEDRPQSSDGVFGKSPLSLRPTLSKRESANSEARIGIDPKTGKEVVFGRSGKKKRFPMLRKAFGLHD